MGQVLLLTGAARSGKSRWVFEAICRGLRRAEGRLEVLVVLPSNLAVRELSHRLAEQFPVLQGVRLLTPKALALEVLRKTGAAVAIAKPWQELLLVKTVLDDAMKAGKLSELAPLAELPLPPVALLNQLKELSRLGLAPEALRKATRVKQFAKAAELALLLAAWRKELDKAGLLDQAEALRRAAYLIEAGAPGLPDWPSLLVDDFQDFTSDEQRLLAALAHRAGETCFTFRYEEGKPRLYEAQERALFIGDRLPEYRERVLPTPRASSQLERLGQRLFAEAEESSANQPEEATAVFVYETTALREECDAAARLLVELARLEGYEWNELALFYPAPSVYEPALAASLARYRVPSTLREGQPLAGALAPRLALGLLELAEGTATTSTLEPLLQTGWPFDSEEAREAIQAELAQARLRGVETPPGALIEQALDRALESVALAAWHKLSETLAEFRKLPGLPELAEALGLLLRQALPALLALPEETLPVQCQAFSLVLDCLSAPLLAREAKLPALQAARARLVALVAEGQLRAPASSERGVLCASVDQARSCSPKVAVLVGLEEGVFPAKASASPLLRESEKQALGAKLGGLFLSQSWQEARERRLFQTVVTRPSERLYLLRSTMDEVGRPKLPSPFLAEIKRHLVFTEGSPNWRRQRVGEVLPSPEEAGSREELLDSLALALQSAYWPDETRQIAATVAAWNLVQGSARALAQLAERLRASAYSEARELPAPAVLGEIKSLATRMTATQLDDFRNCPLKYYFGTLLRLRTPEDEPYALLRGIAAHEALSWLGRNLLHGKPRTALAALSASEVDEWLLKAREEGLRKADKPGSPLAPAEKAALEAWLGRVLRLWWQWELASETDFVPERFELAFGEGAQAELPALSLHFPELDLRLEIEGRLDRVDKSPDGALRLVDYKSSSADPSTYTPGKPGALRSLQLALYAMAVARLGPVVAADYMLLQGLESKSDTLASSLEDPAARKLLLDTVANTLTALMAGGYQPPEDDTVCRGCKYLAVCRRDRYREALTSESRP